MPLPDEAGAVSDSWSRRKFGSTSPATEFEEGRPRRRPRQPHPDTAPRCREALRADVARQNRDRDEEAAAAKRFKRHCRGFGNLVYEQPDSLKPGAERFKLQVRTSPWIAKGVNRESRPARTTPSCSAALFRRLLKNKANTMRSRLRPARWCRRACQHQPAGQRSFDEAKARSPRRLKKAKATELAQKDGQPGSSSSARRDRGGEVGAGAQRFTRDAQGLPREFLDSDRHCGHLKLPAYVGIPVAEAGTCWCASPR